MSETTTAVGGNGGKNAGKPGRIARLRLFMRQVVAELRKVIWPTRKELITYTWVVIVFVAVLTAIVAALDFVLAKGVLQIFG